MIRPVLSRAAVNRLASGPVFILHFRQMLQGNGQDYLGIPMGTAPACSGATAWRGLGDRKLLHGLAWITNEEFRWYTEQEQYYLAAEMSPSGGWLVAENGL